MGEATTVPHTGVALNMFGHFINTPLVSELYAGYELTIYGTVED